MSLEVESIKIFVKETQYQKASASVKFTNSMIISGISIRENQKGELWVSFPGGYKSKTDEKWKNNIFFMDKDVRGDFQKLVLDEYKKEAGDASTMSDEEMFEALGFSE